MKWLRDLLDKHAPGWRRDVACPVCKKKVHPLAVTRHLEAAHGVARPGPAEPRKP